MALLAAALIMGGFLFVWFHFVTRHGLELPRSIGGYQRVDNAGTKADVKQIQVTSSKTGLKALAGGYGHSGRGFSLIVVEDPPVGFPPAPVLFSTWAGALAKDGRVTAVVGQMRQTEADGGVTIDCAPLVGAASGSLCVWTGPHTAGILMGVGIGMPEAQGLTAEASQAIA